MSLILLFILQSICDNCLLLTYNLKVYGVTFFPISTISLCCFHIPKSHQSFKKDTKAFHIVAILL
uniref:Uncharacterized protein n=1 Tax=Rhizophora mucronata TaxID=61149 RepID=A0A2P2Q8R2_RHIMU